MKKLSVKATEKLISKNIQDKKYILYFIPENLLSIRDVKTIKYDGFQRNGKPGRKTFNLKTNYLAGIIHFFIMFYYRSKREQVYISTDLFRFWYGTDYNYYVQYLEKINIIKKTKNYVKGQHCNMYKMNDKFLKSKIKRIKMDDNFLLKRWKKNKVEDIARMVNKTKRIDSMVILKLVNDLYSVELDYDSAIDKLEEMYSTGIIDDNKYRKNKISLDQLHSGDIYHKEDKYGRFHTNFTSLRKEFRNNFIKIDGEEVTELDIDNSQPLLLSILMRDRKAHLDPMFKDSFEKFYKLVTEKKFYKYIMDNYNIEKDEAKDITFNVLFGRNWSTTDKSKHGNANRVFKNLFPGIYTWIVKFKKDEEDYKLLSCKLQGMESELIFNRIVFNIMKHYPEVKIFTVHDSIYFQKKHFDVMEKLFYTHLETYIA